MEGPFVTSFYNYGNQAAYRPYQHIAEGKKPKRLTMTPVLLWLHKENPDTYGPSLKVKADLR